ncbi:MAG: sulfite exporter TauE/SafE family protein [Sulfolobales archaeon]
MKILKNILLRNITEDWYRLLELLNIYTILVVAFFAGLLGSLTGLGGASIMTPILVGLGFPIKHSIANAMISVIATSAGSSAAYVRDRITNPRAAMYLEMFTIVGGIIGATITLVTPSVILYFFFAIFLIAMNLYSYLERKKADSSHENLNYFIDRFSRWLNIYGEYYDHSEKRTIKYVVKRAHIGGPMMIVAGVAAGSLGIGAGAFKTSIQESILGLPTKVASTTSNFIIGMTGLAATTVYISSGYVNPVIAGTMALGTTLGSLVGSKILPHIRISSVRVLSIAITIYIIAQMLYKGVSALWI